MYASQNGYKLATAIAVGARSAASKFHVAATLLRFYPVATHDDDSFLHFR